MISEAEANEKVENGWLKTWMIFEVLAVREDLTKESLESLINKLDSDRRVKVYKKQFGDVLRVEKPLENVKEGFTQTCEVELIAKNLDDLVQIVIEYGPSSVEMLEPSKFNLDAGQAQTILNDISHMMHQFAAAGVGGIVFMREKREKL